MLATIALSHKILVASAPKSANIAVRRNLLGKGLSYIIIVLSRLLPIARLVLPNLVLQLLTC